MSDIDQVGRSVVRIPVAGPAPNNVLVYVRAQFPPGSRPLTGRIVREQLLTVTLYQIAGFDQSLAHEYARTTKISVTGWLNLVRSLGPQEITFAIDEVWGGLTPDGHVEITANIASQATDFQTVHDYGLSAYILTREPEYDYSKPPIEWSSAKVKAASDPSLSYKAGIGVHPPGRDDALVMASPFTDPKAIRHRDS